MSTPAPAAPNFARLAARVRHITVGAGANDAKLLRVCELLRQSVPHYAWVGFYRADNARRELTLGPFSGEPTEHARIPYGRGICGQAAERLAPFVVPDVSREANYLSCNARVKAEVVLPVFRDGVFVAELDIDSHHRAPFTDLDMEFLREVCAAVAPLFAAG